ncbi:MULTISPECIES: CBU_0592 family membrane protein [Sphingomonas]|uniref:CBU_0592 family membrane protein n=1 Tax=Sphingomonas TaxID=13687 RepID=UPI000DEEF085|nr:MULTISPECIES: hypothetical protein [Sphingomonas]
MEPKLLIEIAGWVGAVLILLAYGLLTAGKIPARSLAYQGMNVVGAIGFIINSYANGAMPSAALNVVWALIGLVAISRLPRRPAPVPATTE